MLNPIIITLYVYDNHRYRLQGIMINLESTSLMIAHDILICSEQLSKPVTMRLSIC